MSTTGVFDMCDGACETWHAFYTVACLCDQPADMAALCGQARQALGADWPWDAGATPKPYDIFCKLGELGSHVGSVGGGAGSHVCGGAGSVGGGAGNGPRGYDPASYYGPTSTPYSFVDWGRVELVGIAVAKLSPTAPPVSWAR